MDMFNIAYLGAGARDGDPMHNMSAALRLLSEGDVVIQAVSSLYLTQPVDLPGDTPLLNAAIALRTSLGPRGLLALCRAVEAALGRRRSRAPGAGPDPAPRPIDLDLLLHGEFVIEAPDLVVPHPRMQDRRFVLVPLAEIAPAVVHPVIGLDIRTLRDRCPDTAWVRLATPPGRWWPPAPGGSSPGIAAERIIR